MVAGVSRGAQDDAQRSKGFTLSVEQASERAVLLALGILTRAAYASRQPTPPVPWLVKANVDAGILRAAFAASTGRWSPQEVARVKEEAVDLFALETAVEHPHVMAYARHLLSHPSSRPRSGGI